MASKYDPLIEHLAAHQGANIVLTFAEIETIIGGTLPLSATIMTEYWSGTRFPHTRSLRARGWYGRIDRPYARVRFTRVDTLEFLTTQDESHAPPYTRFLAR